MKKNVLKGTFIGFLIIILLSAGIYLGLSRYYIGGFSYNTWINGIYCTGKSVAEVNEELRHSFHFDKLSIVDKEGNSYDITAEDINYTFDFRESLEFYMQKQNPYLWIDDLIVPDKEKKIIPVIDYDKNAFYKIVSALPIIRQAEGNDTKIVAITRTDDGYVLINQRENVLNRNKAIQVIEDAVNQFASEVDLKEMGCYEDLFLTERMKADLALWPRIREFQDCRIIYQIGEEQIPIDASVVCDWISVDEEGNFLLDRQGQPVLDEIQIASFIRKLAKEYDTVGSKREFQASRGETVIVEGGIYGNQLDQEAEVAYLTEAFLAKKDELHVPAYTQTAVRQGKDDIGDTYIEIDMTNQMLYYYVKGELIIETPVVTGNISLRRGTPSGVNYVYLKQRDRILRGEDYASPVKFWIPVKGGIGIHDASWRSKYGGEIYKTNGSHGCINTPYDAVKQLYELVEIGTPCVMFY